MKIPSKFNIGSDIIKNKDVSKNKFLEKPLFSTFSKLATGIEPVTSALPRKAKFFIIQNGIVISI